MRLTLIRILVIAVAVFALIFMAAIAWPVAIVVGYVIEQIIEPLLTTKI